VWEATLNQLLLRVTRQNYDTWLRSTIGLRFDGTTLVVAAASELACDWLSTRMRAVIAQALTSAAGPGLQLRFEPFESPCLAGSQPLQPSLLPGLTTPLNPRFTFETFLEADFNQMALTAAQDVAIAEGSTFSPLFVTGDAGSGKTHLLHAIAHAAAARGSRVLLAGAEQFLGEYTTAVRKRSLEAFRARFREPDVLLIDDVHLLLGKRATLNELHLTLAALGDQGKRAAVAGQPIATKGASGRFATDLCWGLIAAIATPGIEDRIRFLAAKAAIQNVHLPDEVQHYLALRARTTMRDLEGAINRVTALARISPDPVTIDFAARALQPVGNGANPEPPSPTSLLQAVCTHLSVNCDDVVGAKRRQDLAYARHLAMYLLRRDAGLTYAAIATLLGKKDHSTVVHAYSQLEKQLTLSPSLRADIDAIRAALHNANTAA
jgi:chromosomal replication initiator protein